MDWLSFGLGVLLGAVITLVLMVFLLLRVACRSYELGWHDRDEGKDIGDKRTSERAT